MLGTCDIVAFVATTDLPRSRDFYTHALGLEAVAEDSFACTLDAHGTAVRLTRVDEATIAPYTVLGWSVPDIDAAIGTLRARGVIFERFPGMDQDDRGIWRAPGGAQVAWFKDPDGNTLSLTQSRGGDT